MPSATELLTLTLQLQRLHSDMHLQMISRPPISERESVSFKQLYDLLSNKLATRQYDELLDLVGDC